MRQGQESSFRLRSSSLAAVALPFALLLGASDTARAQSALATSLPTPAPKVSPTDTATVQLGSASLVLLEMRLSGYLLADSITAYQAAQKIFLPLGEVARALTIAIQVNPAARTASGFVRREDSGFALNVPARLLEFGGQRSQLDPSVILLQDDDIYVESRALANWLKVEFQINLNSLQVEVRPVEPLPIQQRLARERMAGVLPGHAPEAGPALPPLPLDFRLADVPFIDQTLALGLRRGDGSTSTVSSTTYMKGDFAGVQGSFFYSGTNADRDQARFTLGRSDPSGELLGPLRARNVAIGNVPVAGILNLNRSNDSGRGITLNNLPLDRPTRFNTHTLQGDLPPGWDVELFFNDALVAYQQSRPDGKYRFDDLPLVFGPNEFRLVFHGPQGQLRVEKQSFLLDESITTPGNLLYNLASTRDTDGLRHSVLTGEYGLNQSLTLAGSMVNDERVDGSTGRYNSLGLRAFTGPALFTGNFTRQGEGGTLSDFGFKTRIAKTSISYNRLLASRDFSSDYFPTLSDPVRVRDRLRIDGMLPGSVLGTLPYNLQLQRDRSDSGAAITDVTGLVSANWGSISVSNQLHLGVQPGYRAFDGTLSTGSSFGTFRLRGQVNYAFRPEARFTALAINGDRSLGGGYQVNLGATRSFVSPELRLALSLNKSIGDYGVAITTGYSSYGVYNVGLVFFMGIGREPRTGRWMKSALPVAETGAASALVFLDRNGNGKMDAGDERLSNVGFNVNGSAVPTRTGSDGIAYIDRLMPWRTANVTLNRSTLDDPQLSPRTPGYRLLPRQGRVAEMEFPVVYTGEIDGIVRLEREGRKRGVSNVQMELLDEAGQVNARTRSDSTGFYHFEEVPPGRYRLRVAPSQLEQLRLQSSAPRLAVVPPEGDNLTGNDFLLESLPGGDK